MSNAMFFLLLLVVLPTIWIIVFIIRRGLGNFMHQNRRAQAIKEKGTIRIRTFVETEKVHVQITDSGIGISDEQMDRLFDPEFSKEGSRVKAGLGLFTSYNIIQKHRGEIKVESGVGKGSTFTVMIPADLEKQTGNV